MAQVLDAIDLFAGAGGLTLGLKQAGIRTSAAVERDPHCAVTFAAHTPDADLYDADIQGVDLSRYRDKFALVYGGPPCQPFSSGGLRAAAADGRDMIPTFIEAIRVIGPHAFLMENVDGLASSTHRTYFADTLQAFRYLGYRVTWKVLNAADYGVPQKRQRLFVVGMRDRVFVFPAPTHGPGRPRPHIAVRDVLPDVHRPLGEPPGSRVFYARNPDLRPSPFDGHLFNGGGRPIDPAQPARTILASAGGNKTHFFDALDLVPEYHRHLADGGAPRAGTLPGARRISVAESAVLQTFPPSVAFAGPRSAQYAQVGNAVPPALARALGIALIRQVDEPEMEPRIECQDFAPRQLMFQV